MMETLRSTLVEVMDKTLRNGNIDIPFAQVNPMEQDMIQRAVEVCRIIHILDSFLTVAYADGINGSDNVDQVIIYTDGNWTPEFLGGLEYRFDSAFLSNFYLKEGGLGENLVKYMRSNSEISLRGNIKLMYDQEINSISIRKFGESGEKSNKVSGNKAKTIRFNTLGK